MKTFRFLFWLPCILLLSACNFVKLADVDVTREFDVPQTFHSLEASGEMLIYMDSNKPDAHYYITDSNLDQYVHVFQKGSKLSAYNDPYTIKPSAKLYYTKVYIPQEHGLSNIQLKGNTQFVTNLALLNSELKIDLSSKAKLGDPQNYLVIQGSQVANIYMSGNSELYLMCNGNMGTIRGELRDNAKIHMKGTPTRNEVVCKDESAIIKH